MGAPQLPQQGGLEQAPFSGGGHPSAAVGANSYADFSKINKMPSPPTWEDAMGQAEAMQNQMGFKKVGDNSGVGLDPGMTKSIMDSMNEQYKTQGELHAGLWGAHLQAAHLHNSDLAMQERARRDDMQNAYLNKALTQKGSEGQANRDLKGRQGDVRADLAADKESEVERKNKVDEKRKSVGNAISALIAGEGKLSPEEKAMLIEEAGLPPEAAKPGYFSKMFGGGDTQGAPTNKQWPTAPSNDVDMLKAGKGTAAQFEEHYGPGSAKKAMGQ
jgi:hypothetical protein